MEGDKQFQSLGISSMILLLQCNLHTVRDLHYMDKKFQIEVAYRQMKKDGKIYNILETCDLGFKISISLNGGKYPHL